MPLQQTARGPQQMSPQQVAPGWHRILPAQQEDLGSPHMPLQQAAPSEQIRAPHASWCGSGKGGPKGASGGSMNVRFSYGDTWSVQFIGGNVPIVRFIGGNVPCECAGGIREAGETRKAGDNGSCAWRSATCAWRAVTVLESWPICSFRLLVSFCCSVDAAATGYAAAAASLPSSPNGLNALNLEMASRPPDVDADGPAPLRCCALSVAAVPNASAPSKPTAVARWRKLCQRPRRPSDPSWWPAASLLSMS
mmetsp:Transcript_40203/g.85770  ORF Transcript_40203/g.85770 Transcript_40203/m.85770 type:complete len:251 (+) Transcript_40203:185-937(+)